MKGEVILKRYNIKEVAQIFNITTNKLRFYEKKGLVVPERNDENNYRYYNEEDLIRIHTILMYRALNLSVEDIKDIMKNSNKNNMIKHFYKQWEVINDEMHRMRLIKESLEDVMDLIYESEDYNFKEGIIHSAKRLSEIKEIKDNWKDKWNFDSWAKTYDVSVRADKGSLKLYKNYDKILDTVYEEAVNGLESHNKVLEIGVGTGNLASKFLESGYDIMGLDQSREMLNVAKEKYPKLKLRLGEFLKLPFENNAFHCIVSTYAFHHLNEEEKKVAIKEMVRVLKEDGRIVIGDMMFENEKSREEIFSTFTDEQIEEVEDEFYSNIEMLQKEFKEKGRKLYYKRIDQLNYVVIAEK